MGTAHGGGRLSHRRGSEVAHRAPAQLRLGVTLLSDWTGGRRDMAGSRVLPHPSPFGPKVAWEEPSHFQKTGMISCRYSWLFAEQRTILCLLSLLSWHKAPQRRGPGSRRPGRLRCFNETKPASVCRRQGSASWTHPAWHRGPRPSSTSPPPHWPTRPPWAPARPAPTPLHTAPPARGHKQTDIP